MVETKRTLDKEQINFLINLIDPVDSIVQRYETSSYESALNGMKVGLKKCVKNKRYNTKLDLYLT